MPELDIDHVPSLKLRKPLKKPTKQIKKQAATVKKHPKPPESYFQGNTSGNNTKLSTWTTVVG